jgi:hypothetical protein
MSRKTTREPIFANDENGGISSIDHDSEVGLYTPANQA